jgi:hypothetical protein
MLLAPAAADDGADGEVADVPALPVLLVVPALPPPARFGLLVLLGTSSSEQALASAISKMGVKIRWP